MTDCFVHRGFKIERRGKRWRWRARVSGKVVRVSSTTLREACERLDLFLDRRSRSLDAQRSARFRLSVRELCEAWMIDKQPRIAPGTAAQYHIHINAHIAPRLGDFDADAVLPKDLEAFYALLRWKAAKESHNVLRQAFEWGLRNELLLRAANPCLVVRPSRRACIDHDGTFDGEHVLSRIRQKAVPQPDEIEKLLIDAEERNLWTWWLYIKLAVTTGARPGEVCALRRQHVDFERRTVLIEWSADKVSGKIKRPKSPSGVRTLLLPTGFFESIQCVLPTEPHAFLFPSNTRPGWLSPLPCWNARSVKRRLDAALIRSGLPHYTPHSFRHYVATHLLNQGWPPLQVARFLGHGDDSLVRRLYANHIVDDTQRLIGEAAARLS